MTSKPGSVKRATPWLWVGYDRRGKCHEGVIWAETETIARARLRHKHIQVVSVQRCLRWQMGHVGAREMSLCIRQLATLVQVGLSLVQCFDVLISSTPHRVLNRLLNDMRNHVASGSPLSDAFRRWPRYFDTFFCYLIAASESIGGLDTSLQRLAIHMEKRLSVRNKIRTALVYPTIVILEGLCITTIILTTVIPPFRDLFNSLGAQLPVTTLFVLCFSEWLASWYLLLLGIAVGVTITLICLWRCNEAFRASVVHLVACLPLIGSFIRKAYLARWAACKPTLLKPASPEKTSAQS